MSAGGGWTVAGRRCVVTGATSGIGRETALALARAGAEVVLIARNRARGEATVNEIRSAKGATEVDLVLADLSSQRQVRAAAEAVLSGGKPIHVLVNNAGVVNLQYSETEDGVETMFAVNHLAYFLLTNLLLERIVASAPARIVNVASDAHRVGRLDFDDLGGKRRYRAMRLYAQSKLANVLFTRELATRLEGTGVSVNALHPGAVATGLGKNNGRFSQVVTTLLKPFFRTPERGAATSIHLAVAPELEGVSGEYFAKRKIARASAAARDEAVARRLWNVSEALTRASA